MRPSISMWEAMDVPRQGMWTMAAAETRLLVTTVLPIPLS